MKYMALYVEVIPVDGISDMEIRIATTRTLSGIPIKALGGTVIGRIVHAQVTEGPKPTKETP